MNKVLFLLIISILSISTLWGQDTIHYTQDSLPIIESNAPTFDSSELINSNINTIIPTHNNTFDFQYTDSLNIELKPTSITTIETAFDSIQDTLTPIETAEPTLIDSTLSEDTLIQITTAKTIHNDRQEIDSLYAQIKIYIHKLDSCKLVQESTMQQLHGVQDELGITTKRLDQLSHLRDSLLITNEKYQKELRNTNSLLEDQVKAMKEKEALLQEKEAIYREAMTSSTIDKAKLEGEIQSKNISIEAKAREIGYLQRDIDSKSQTLTAQLEDYERLTKERDRYMHIVDSLRAMVRAAELENVRKDEANKYLAKRAKDAEEKVAQATSRKRKVRPIQGIAMRLFRTPNWEILLTPEIKEDGSTTYNKTIRNRNAGNVEFDFVTGASVMLWDLTKYFNPKQTVDSISKKHAIPNFDQQFAYDLGLYVGFGGSNIFKNFYIAPSFRFVDFFYITIGINICEYELLDEGYSVGKPIDAGLTLDNITSKVWKVKPFIAFNIDLDFLSYIKR